MSTAIVLGGASGIGAAVVRALRQQGDGVLVADHNVRGGKALVDEQLPGRAEFFDCDLATADGPALAVEAAIRFGGGKLHTLFYNAGILTAKPLAEWTLADWDRSTAVNLRGAFLAAQAAAEPLRASGRGRIIVTASTGALRGHAGMPAYHATKAGLLGLVRALADELAPGGTTVNAICPGWIDTPFNDTFWEHQTNPKEALASLVSRIPLGRQGAPLDVAGAVLFLASPAAAYITGQSLVIDGGYTAV
ncbi:SDR family NAD(P)-dependent oxidoreductase [Arthrobacter sp. 35W]|uniref:SDR family NAD(P)-dependent oxidoreductase n=1 Tax=Arthrobacter sp. 35W TaxID=1132441 RepID=UPI000412D7CD|nr:SDR family NAD(P)-dependent oxidoreductase [Arthrobacter sp. 35W]